MSISLQTGLYELCRLRMEKDAEFLSEHPDADIEHVDDALFDEYRLFQLKRTYAACGPRVPSTAACSRPRALRRMSSQALTI